MNEQSQLTDLLEDTFNSFRSVVDDMKPHLRTQEIGVVIAVGQGIARVNGLAKVKSEEVVSFWDGSLGLVFNLDIDEIGVILLDKSDKIAAGSQVQRTGHVLDVPVGQALLGRIIDPLGRPLDALGSLEFAKRMPAEREAPKIIDRAPVTVPLQTGIKVIDALIPIGRGQRELILGDRQTGKSAIALDTILNQKEKNVICIYCAIGQRSSSVAKLIGDLRRLNALEYCVVVVAAGDDPAGLQYIAPYAATTMAEYFMEQGQDALIVYDDLTSHARSYRELSLLLRRPPGREAFPGDIFYIHSRLLERSTHLISARGGGSLTSLPILETEDQNIAAYIPTNLISITDGQIYLSPTLFQKGILPAVDVVKSVSRVGGKTQLEAYRQVAGDLKLSYAQFEELETFSRFGTRIDPNSKLILERGLRVRELLKQEQYQPMPVSEQIYIQLALTSGLFDQLELDCIQAMQSTICEHIKKQLPSIGPAIDEGRKLSKDELKSLLVRIENCLTRAHER